MINTYLLYIEIAMLAGCGIGSGICSLSNEAAFTCGFHGHDLPLYNSIRSY